VTWLDITMLGIAIAGCASMGLLYAGASIALWLHDRDDRGLAIFGVARGGVSLASAGVFILILFRKMPPHHLGIVLAAAVFVGGNYLLTLLARRLHTRPADGAGVG
jgi:uncharacterized BrkB/YihY/UPF0761 family membrane protein